VREAALEQAVAIRRHGIDEATELGAGGVQLVGRRTGTIGIGGPPAQVAVRELADGLDDQLLIVIEREVHAQAVPQNTVRLDCKWSYNRE